MLSNFSGVITQGRVVFAKARIKRVLSIGFLTIIIKSLRTTLAETIPSNEEGCSTRPSSCRKSAWHTVTC